MSGAANDPAVWFPAFVDETVKTYLDLNESQKRAAYFETAERARSIAEGASAFTGFMGEAIVSNVLHSNVYLAKRTKGSQSPADIWGWKNVKHGFFHLPLVQVKSARNPSTHEQLSDEEQRKVEVFTDFVWTRFHESDVVHADYKKVPLVISAHYFGCTLGTDAIMSKGIEYLGCIYSGTLDFKKAVALGLKEFDAILDSAT